MTDIERAAKACYEEFCQGHPWEEATKGWKTAMRESATAVIESVLLEPSEEVVEASAQAGLQEFCQPLIAVAWSELQPMAKTKWKAIARANIRAAALVILGREPNKPVDTPPANPT